MPKVILEPENDCLENGMEIKRCKDIMFDMIDRQIKEAKIKQHLENDPVFIDEINKNRETISQLKFSKVDTHPYDIIKNKQGYEALNKHQAQCRRIHIKEYRTVKKVKGEEVVTVNEVNSNSDIIKIWAQDLQD